MTVSDDKEKDDLMPEWNDWIEYAAVEKKEKEELKGDVKKLKNIIENINMWLRLQVLSATAKCSMLGLGLPSAVKFL